MLVMLRAIRILPSVRQAKKAVTRISAMIMVFFRTNSRIFVFVVIAFSPLLEVTVEWRRPDGFSPSYHHYQESEERMQAMIFS